MSLLFPGTPVVAPDEHALLGHTSRHFFNRAERWHALGDFALRGRFEMAIRQLQAAGWTPNLPSRLSIPSSWRAPLQSCAPDYVRLTLEAVQDAVARKRVWASEPADGSSELRLAYVGRPGIFVVAPLTGAERPFRTAFRVRSPRNLGIRIEDEGTFTTNALQQAKKRQPRDLARWEARAVRRAQRAASSRAGAGRTERGRS